MNMKLKRSMWLASCMLAAGGGTLGTAVAQENSDATTRGNSEIDEIIVTARRVEERLTDVPISISVLNQKQLDNLNITNSADLTKYVPSLSLDGRFGTEAASFSLRGFFQELGSSPTVAVYFAEAVAPRGSLGQTTGGDGVGPGALFDLENVQVLKGPQGTLFGRNTTGGAILLVPTKPKGEYSGYVEAAVGNYESRRIQGVVNLPFSDNVRVRLGVDHMQRDGWQDNVWSVGPDHFANVDYLAARASLVVDLTPNLENYFIGTYSKSDTYGVQNNVLGCNPTAGLGPILTLLSMCSAHLARDAGNFYAVQNGYPSNRDPQSYLKQWQLINTTSWAATDNLTVKNIVTYGEFISRYTAEPFGDNFVFDSSAPALQQPALAGLHGLVRLVEGEHLHLAQSYPALGYDTNSQATFTEEVQIQGNAFDSRLTWQTGLYYEQSEPIDPTGGLPNSRAICYDQDNLDCFDIFSLLTAGASQGGLNANFTEIKFRDYGVYGQVNYALTNQVKLNAGIRYTRDEMEGRGSSTIIGFRPIALNPAAPGANRPVFSCFFADATPVNPTDLQKGCVKNVETESDAPTWVVGVDFKPVDDLLLYAKYSRGYRQGGVNPRTVIDTYEEEKVDAYEIGSKYAFGGDISGNFNLAAFYTDFTNQQLLTSLTINLPGAAPQQSLVNLGASRIYGVEFDTSLDFFHYFRVDLSGAYLNSKVTDVGNSSDVVALLPPQLQAPGVAVINTKGEKGQPLPITPEYRVGVTGTFFVPMPEAAGELSLSVNYTYTSEAFATSPGTFTSPDVPRAKYFPEVELVNLNVNWNNVAQLPLDVGIFVTNLLEEEYIANLLGGYDSLGFEAGRQGEPRMYGMSVRYRFGD